MYRFFAALCVVLFPLSAWAKTFSCNAGDVTCLIALAEHSGQLQTWVGSQWSRGLKRAVSWAWAGLPNSNLTRAIRQLLGLLHPVFGELISRFSGLSGEAEAPAVGRLTDMVFPLGATSVTLFGGVTSE